MDGKGVGAAVVSHATTKASRRMRIIRVQRLLYNNISRKGASSLDRPVRLAGTARIFWSRMDMSATFPGVLGIEASNAAGWEQFRVGLGLREIGPGSSSIYSVCRLLDYRRPMSAPKPLPTQTS